MPAFSNAIHLTQEALNTAETKGVNKLWIFLMFGCTLNKASCWETEQDTAGAGHSHTPLAGEQRDNVMSWSEIR